ncbi:MAG: aminopeptidase P N-terminal domain-containing protein [Cocleimonas sp.]|nr:aminopeptidase P N-terminal domain-containing protein [Cocleimonas sp.]
MHSSIIKSPQFPANEFSNRRDQLLQMIGTNAIAIVPSALLKIRNRDAEFPFRQESDFLYLTNFNEPDAVAVFVPERKEGEYILFCREKNAKTERWTGRMAGLEGAVEDYGADDAFPIEDIDDIVPGLMENRTAVHYSMGADAAFDQQVMSWMMGLRTKIRSGVKAPHELVSLDLILHDMRLYKSPAEHDFMRHAAKTAIVAHQRAMALCRSGLYEYQLEAEILHEFRRNGMEVAYTSIVGSGENGCILHYIENNAVLKEGDLVLIDAGAEYQGYASDITRTFPVSGQFSEPQKQLYQIVLNAQYAAIEQAKAGNTWNQPHEAAVRVIVAGLLEIGLLTGDLDTIIAKEKKKEVEQAKEKSSENNKDDEPSYKQFYMHKTGHWLGLDVHDVGDYKIDEAWRLLEAGMVMTVEPGLYISPDETIDKKWWNIGIRIEDDVLITAEGNEVLTQSLVKEIDAIEQLMAK